MPYLADVYPFSPLDPLAATYPYSVVVGASCPGLEATVRSAEWMSVCPYGRSHHNPETRYLPAHTSLAHQKSPVGVRVDLMPQGRPLLRLRHWMVFGVVVSWVPSLPRGWVPSFRADIIRYDRRPGSLHWRKGDEVHYPRMVGTNYLRQC